MVPVTVHIADGGYLAWTYGCKEGTQDEWENARHWYSRNNRHLILMDSPSSYRKALDAHYKSKRIERRIADPRKEETQKRVVRFTEFTIKTDERLSTLQWHGLEADDLIALYTLSHQGPDPIAIVGVDKDLLQLPFTKYRLRKINDERVVINNYVRKLPLAIQPYVKRGRDVLLCLALMGDRSDSVLRIAPLRDFRQMIELLHHPRPFQQAARWFGKFEVGRNAYLTVLPGPWVFTKAPTPAEVIDRLDDGSWWQWTPDLLEPGLLSAVEITRESFRDEKKILHGQGRLHKVGRLPLP